MCTEHQSRAEATAPAPSLLILFGWTFWKESSSSALNEVSSTIAHKWLRNKNTGKEIRLSPMTVDTPSHSDMLSVFLGQFYNINPAVNDDILCYIKFIARSFFK